MCVVQPRNDEAGNNKEGEIPRRQQWRRSTRRAPPNKLISHEENCHLLSISPNEEFPNKESMTEADEV
jgi:hypothetical protein